MAGGGESTKALAAVLIVAVAAFALMQGGCGGGGGARVGGTTGGATGRLVVTSVFDDATRSVPGYADSLRVTVTAPAGVTLPGTFPNPFLLTRANTSRSLDGLAPSARPYVLDIHALTDGTVVGSIQRSIVIAAGDLKLANVSANLQSKVESVTVEGASPLVWSEGQYTAFARDGQGLALFSGAGFSFTSSNPTVLSIDQFTGIATVGTFGSATITAELVGTGMSGLLGVTVNTSKIVFFSRRDGNFEIYTMNSDGSGLTRLTNNAPLLDWHPAISSDGSRIAFVSNRDWNYEIYVMNVDGSGQKNLTNNAAVDQDPAFNMDGSKIVFSSMRIGEPGQSSDIYIMNADGTGQTRLTDETGSDFSPVFSPDGSKIAYNSRRGSVHDIYTMNLDGTEITNVTNSPRNDLWPAYSPDGSMIVYVSRSTSSNDGGIALINADGSGQTQLTYNLFFDAHPSFGPDGLRIVFSSGITGDQEIFVMKTDGTSMTNLTNSPRSDGHPAMSLRQN